MVRRWLLPPVTAVFAMSLVALFLTDRAPAYTTELVGRLWALGSRFQRRFGFDVIDRAELPLDFDTVGHFTAWFIAAVIGTVVVSDRLDAASTFFVLLLASAGFEVAQLFLTSSRGVSASDMMANGVGVLAGMSVAAVVTGVTRQSLAHRRHDS